MRDRTIPALAVLALSLAVPAGEAAAQAGDSAAAEGFTRRYIDVESRRSSRVLLRDWPELSRLLTWTRGLEEAVAEADETLSAELVESFRARVDTLARSPIPEFLASRRDSVRAAIDSIGSRLDRAEAALEEADPTGVRPTGEQGENAADRQRTLVTGKTAVTVPAGVEVGDRDTLPEAVIEGGEPETYVDFLALALAELDGLVHLVRTVEVSGSPAPREPAPPRDTERPRRER